MSVVQSLLTQRHSNCLLTSFHIRAARASLHSSVLALSLSLILSISSFKKKLRISFSASQPAPRVNLPWQFIIGIVCGPIDQQQPGVCRGANIYGLVMVFTFLSHQKPYFSHKRRTHSHPVHWYTLVCLLGFSCAQCWHLSVQEELIFWVNSLLINCHAEWSFPAAIRTLLARTCRAPFCPAELPAGNACLETVNF